MRLYYCGMVVPQSTGRFLMPRVRPYRPVAGLLSACALALGLSGCAHFAYYGQSIAGQLDLMARARPIAALLEDPATVPELRARLTDVVRVREFATRELALPDNGSYRDYAELGRQYVVWNVYATPELALTPRQWCFPVAGCVAYRGYFSKAGAEEFARTLRAHGDDVQVAGVAAYSTLGWFSDPLPSTIVHRSETGIAGLIFHELSHQRLYVRGDSAFNESFAMTVELEGVRRWLDANGRGEKLAGYLRERGRREDFAALIMRYRERLGQLYASPQTDDAKRAGKARAFAQLRAEYAGLKTSWDGYDGYDAWFAQDLNNAHLASVGLYHQHVPAFERLLAGARGDLPAFYAAAERIARLPGAERAATLRALGGVEDDGVTVGSLSGTGVDAAP